MRLVHVFALALLAVVWQLVARAPQPVVLHSLFSSSATRLGGGADASCAACALPSPASLSLSAAVPEALGAEVSASGCALEAMERVNEARGGTPPAPTPALTDLPQEVLHPLLSQLVKQPFFRYFRVNLQGRCPFWAEDGMCALPDCSVCECPADEVPLPWRVEAPPSLEVEAPMGGPLTPQTAECVGESGGEEGEASARLNAVEGLVNREGLDTRTLRVWGAADNPWTLEDERKVEEDPGCAYVNLLLNPERYTGYSGEHAHRVWGAIYAQACFNGLGTRGSSLCGGGPASEAPEPRVFYRLVSGLHASISAHIAGEYLLQRRGASEVWGPNYALFQERLGEHPERLQNLRFITAFVLRAVAQARPFLLAADYSTGFPVDDAATRALLRQLLDSPALRPSCAVPFDETRMFTGKQGPRLKEEVQLHFRNISAVMDCVGCEKCRLWGKLQTLGLGTAMKILFPAEPGAPADLHRNEVIALLNLMHRLSESLRLCHDMQLAVAGGALEVQPAPAPRHSNVPHFLF